MLELAYEQRKRRKNGNFIGPVHGGGGRRRGRRRTGGTDDIYWGLACTSDSASVSASTSACAV